MNNITIKEYNQELHANAAHTLDKLTFPELGSNRDEFDNYKGWVLLNETNDLVGIVAYTIKSTTEWDFDLLIVSNEYGGKGFGTKLMTKLTELADKNNVTMSTRAYKGKANLIRLYEKFGFKKTGIVNKIGSPKMIRKPNELKIINNFGGNQLSKKIDYNSKYLKYKKKYINLKVQRKMYQN